MEQLDYCQRCGYSRPVRKVQDCVYCDTRVLKCWPCSMSTVRCACRHRALVFAFQGICAAPGPRKTSWFRRKHLD